MKKYVVDGKEVLLAIRNWDKIMNKRNSDYLIHNGPYRFSTFVGKYELVAGRYTPVSSPIVNWGWLVTEPAYNKIMLMASPHHYALLHAFKAKTGWQGIIP